MTTLVLLLSVHFATVFSVLMSQVDEKNFDSRKAAALSMNNLFVFFSFIELTAYYG